MNSAELYYAESVIVSSGRLTTQHDLLNRFVCSLTKATKAGETGDSISIDTPSLLAGPIPAILQEYTSSTRSLSLEH